MIAKVHHLVGPAGAVIAEMVGGAVHESGGPLAGPFEELLTENVRGGLIPSQALHGLDHRLDAAADGPAGVELALPGEHLTKVVEPAGIDRHRIAGDEIGEVEPVAHRQRSRHRDTIPCRRR